MNYQEQVKEIEALTKSIVRKSKAFANRNTKEPYYYYEDLLHVISDLKGANNFLK